MDDETHEGLLQQPQHQNNNKIEKEECREHEEGSSNIVVTEMTVMNTMFDDNANINVDNVHDTRCRLDCDDDGTTVLFSSTLQNNPYPNCNDIQDITARQVPNTRLTWEQRQAKRDLKRQLQRKMRIKTLENKIKQAMKVQNEVIIQETRQELRKLLEQENDDTSRPSIAATASPFLSDSSSNISTQIAQSVAHDFLIHLCTKLQEHQHDYNYGRGDSERRQLQNDESAILLKHMTKGTQRLDMFQNEHALHGYTRQKFLERGMVLVKALYRLLPLPSLFSSTTQKNATRHDNDGDDHDNDDKQVSVNNSNVDERRKQRFWELVCQVKSVCSVGCGPGCDAMGVVAFLLQQQHDDCVAIPTTTVDDHDHSCPKLDHVILLDWAMEQWKLILIPLQQMVVPGYITDMEMAVCDIREGLLRPPLDCRVPFDTKATWTNQQAFQLLVTEQHTCHTTSFSCDISLTPIGTTATSASVDDDCNKQDRSPPQKKKNDDLMCCCNVDLFVFSYLLSENRDTWTAFCQDLIQMAKPNALFFFSDPTAWQLHRLLLMFPSCSIPLDNSPSVVMDWIWLDSSMDSPALQCLEGRVGPAVLLGRKL